ncbi:MAG TPA: ferric reductase-like transmembrane domain-containing protein [Candidatus Limnocylindrales bacterium]|nr:ferric reductase-like transmembrane domain-containing protein [Candidatus Limnocylindrales bacterium]
MGDLEFWFIARITGLTAFAVLSLSVLSGEALRTSVLDFLAKNRAIRKLHDFTTPLWLPLVFAHVIALVLDRTARIAPINVVVPFLTDYGEIAIGLGTIAFDIIMIVTITSWLRARMDNKLWMWIHRTSYVGFIAIFFHAALSGTDFDAPLVSALAWSTAAGLGILGISRVVWGRLPG